MIRSVLVLAALALFLSPVSAGDWDPVADPGINTPANTGLVALREFDSYLYIGTENIGGGARIYRTNDGDTFTAVMTGGFGDGVTRINDFELFGGLLYCATAGPLGGSVYRSPDGLAWTLVSPVGLGSASNAEVTSLSNFSGALYAATRNTGGTGAQLWKSTDGTTWTTSVTTTGFGDVDNSAINDLEVGGGYLYAVTTNASDGGQLVRISSGGGTTVLIDDGFGTTKNKALTALEVFNGQLFIGTENSTDGFEIWSTPNDFDFYLRLTGGNDDQDNTRVTDLEGIGLLMYVGVESTGEAFEVLSTAGGGVYDQEDSDGFDDPGNFRSNHFTAFGDQVWCGTSNPSGGGLYHADIEDGHTSASGTYSSGSSHSSFWHRVHCFVATAAWGSPSAPRVAELRRLRDERVEACEAGRKFTGLYRCTAPPVAEVVKSSEVLRALLRKALFR